MTIIELINALEDIAYSDNVEDPEVFIQIGTMQTPVLGVGYFPELENISGESVVIGDNTSPYLIL